MALPRREPAGADHGATIARPAPAVKPEIIAFAYTRDPGAPDSPEPGDRLRDPTSSRPASTPARQTDSRRSRRPGRLFGFGNGSGQTHASGTSGKGEQQFILDELLQVERAGQRQDVVLALGIEFRGGGLAGDEAETAIHRDVDVERRETALALERQRRSRVQVQPDLRLRARALLAPRLPRHPVARRRRAIGGGRIARAASDRARAIRPTARRPRRRTFARRDDGARTDGNSSRPSVRGPNVVHDGTIRCVSAPRLILASTSRYRRELLSRLHLPFEVQAPDVDETPAPSEQPAALARRLATAKAEAIAARAPDAVVIGSDQVADLDGICIGKPGNHERATEQLKSMSGRSVVFHTAVAVVCPHAWLRAHRGRLGHRSLSQADRRRDRALPARRAAVRLRRQRQVRDARDRLARSDRIGRSDRAGRAAADSHLRAVARGRHRPAGNPVAKPVSAPTGSLYLVPNALDLGAESASTALEDVLPLGVIRTAARLEHWIAENAKSTRAFLKRVDAVVPLAQTAAGDLDRRTAAAAEGRTASGRGLGSRRAAGAGPERPRHRPAVRSRPAGRGGSGLGRGPVGSRPRPPGRGACPARARCCWRWLRAATTGRASRSSAICRSMPGRGRPGSGSWKRSRAGPRRPS